MDMGGSTCVVHMGDWERGTPGSMGISLCDIASGLGKFISHSPHCITFPVHTWAPLFCSQQVVLPPLPGIRTGRTPLASTRTSQGTQACTVLAPAPSSQFLGTSKPGASWSPPRYLGGMRCLRVLASQVDSTLRQGVTQEEPKKKKPK